MIEVASDDNPLLQPDEDDRHEIHGLDTIGATQANDIGVGGINDDAPIWLGEPLALDDFAFVESTYFRLVV